MTIPKRMDPVEPDFSIFGSLFYLVAHADFMYHEDLDKVMAKQGVDRTTYRLMTVLMQVGPESVKKLCEYSLLKPSTGSRAIERMREKGWVVTEVSAVDGRETSVALTPVGKKIAVGLRGLTSRQLHRAVNGLSPADLKNVVTVLQQIVHNLSRVPIE